MGLGSELVLLSIGSRGRPHFSPQLAYSLVVAELFELAQAGRIELRGDRIFLVDRTPIGVPLADEQLHRLTGGVVNLRVWLERRAPFRIDSYVGELNAGGVISVRTITMGNADPVKGIMLNESARSAAAARRLVEVCERGRAAEGDALAFVVLARAGRAADAHLRGWSNRKRRAAVDGLVRAVPTTDSPAEKLLAACLGLISELSRKAPTKPGDGRTIDQQIGLTRAGRNAALYWGM